MTPPLHEIIQQVEADEFRETVGDSGFDELRAMHTALERTLVQAVRGPASDRYLRALARAEETARTQRVIRSYRRSGRMA